MSGERGREGEREKERKRERERCREGEEERERGREREGERERGRGRERERERGREGEREEGVTSLYVIYHIQYSKQLRVNFDTYKQVDIVDVGSPLGEA